MGCDGMGCASGSSVPTLPALPASPAAASPAAASPCSRLTPALPGARPASPAARPLSSPRPSPQLYAEDIGLRTADVADDATVNLGWNALLNLFETWVAAQRGRSAGQGAPTAAGAAAAALGGARAQAAKQSPSVKLEASPEGVRFAILDGGRVAVRTTSSDAHALQAHEVRRPRCARARSARRSKMPRAEGGGSRMQPAARQRAAARSHARAAHSHNSRSPLPAAQLPRAPLTTLVPLHIHTPTLCLAGPRLSAHGRCPTG
jgi:hypothetical protein